MKHPTREECERLLQEYGTPEHVRRHCRAVAQTAYTVAEALNHNGYDLNLDLILAAGLLHDIARVEDRHWDVGAELMDRLGYHEEAKIIKVHMDYDFDINDFSVNEADMVCLGDRLVKEDEYVGLDIRIDYIIDKAIKFGHSDHVPRILEKKGRSEIYIKHLESEIGCTIDELMKGTE